MTNCQHRIFVSYSHDDKELMLRVVERFCDAAWRLGQGHGSLCRAFSLWSDSKRTW